jgi:hypothetical protein
MSLENNIPSVYDREDGTKLITADYKRPLTHELNPIEECSLNEKELKTMNIKMDKLKTICEQQDKQIDVTRVLENLERWLTWIEEFDDLDLIYDPKNDTYRFRFYDQEDLIIPLDLTIKDKNLYDETQTTQVEKLWKFIVEIMNNIEEIELEIESWNVALESLNWLQEIVVPDWLFNKTLLATDDIKNIFQLNPNDWPLDKQANRKFNQIWSTIKQAQEHRKTLAWKWIRIK